ncbi:transposase [Deinococcus ruber]|uniref:Transposase n=1 Tax=Deinococcus ruber TaxID=1848197 RepID=A0A918FD68_9DEIO|nr:transposase [Deinococcus ruber]
MIDVPLPNSCMACGYVGELLFKRHDRTWISELRPQAVTVTAYHIPVMACPACGKTVRGQHSNLRTDQVGATAHRCGPRLAATVQTLHHELGVPQRRISRVLQLTTGIQLTQGASTQAAGRLVRDAGPLAVHVAALEQELRSAPYVHHDDTGWRIDATPAWVSTVRSQDTVVFRANLHHTNQELRDVIGNDFNGVLVCDRFNVYDSTLLAKVRQQKCLAHVLRNATAVREGEQGKRGQGHVYGQRLAGVCRERMGLHRLYRKGVCTTDEYRAQGEELTLRLNHLLQRRPLKTVGNERLRLGLLNQHEQSRLLRFLEDPDIPPTNNPAERSLRTVVMARKVSQCSKNALGAQTYMRIKSTVETARLRGQDPVDILISFR